MRYCLFLIFLNIFISTSINCQTYIKVPTDMPAYQREMNTIAKADVYSKTEWNYEISDGKVTANKYKSRIIKYDKIGRIVEIMNISQSGENKSIIIFRYDGQNLTQQETEFLPTGEMIGKTKYTYNQQGRLTDITWLNNLEFIINRKAFDADEKKNLITEWQFYSPDSVTGKIEYYYSNLKNGILQQQNNFTGEDKLNDIVFFHRDSLQNITKEEVRDAHQKLICFNEYQYDKNGLLQQIITILPNESKIPKTVFNYDEDGLITGKIEYNRKGDIIDYKKYIYE